MDFSARMPSSSDYVHALEEERKKMQVFQRELPLCLRLVTHAIETVRRQMAGVNAAAEAEALSDGVPVLEEFIPLKPSSYSSSSDEDRSGVDGDAVRGAEAPAATRKPDWLRSVQLWSQDAADSAVETVAAPTKPVAANAKRMAGAFHPFEREKRVAAPAASTAAASSSTGGGGAGGAAGGRGGGDEKEKEKEGQSQLAHRKVRRSWSPELHRRFMEALEQLGGPHAATPKQIREVMKVDGLTNDEVKSHLQKYRLHNRRPCTAPTALVQTNVDSSSTPIPQFVVVGGIWVPPPTAAAPPVDGPPLAGGGAVFSPATSILPPQLRLCRRQAETKQQQLKCTNCTGEEKKSKGDDGGDEASPATSSSSSQTTTASHLHASS